MAKDEEKNQGTRNTGKRKFTVDQMREALMESGTISGAAETLDCSRNTVKKYCEEYPELDDAIAEAKNHLVDIAESKLMENVKDGHPGSVFFTLKTLGKDRGYVERHENTGKDGGPMDFNVTGMRDVLKGKFKGENEE